MFIVNHKLWIIPFFGLLFGIATAFAFINPYSGTITLSELILQLSGSRGEFPLGFGVVELVELTLKWVYLFCYEIYMGMELYRFFCTASIYIFSRTPCRMKWYAKEIIVLLFCSILYEVAYVSGALITSTLRYTVEFDYPGFFISMVHIIIYSLWVYSFALLVNILAIMQGSSRSFLIVAGIQLVGISLLSVLRFAENSPSVMERVIGLNPIAHLVLGWHSSSIILVNNALHPPFAGLFFKTSVVFLAILCVVLILIGILEIKYHDFLISDTETEAC